MRRGGKGRRARRYLEWPLLLLTLVGMTSVHVDWARFGHRHTGEQATHHHHAHVSAHHHHGEDAGHHGANPRADHQVPRHWDHPTSEGPAAPPSERPSERPSDEPVQSYVASPPLLESGWQTAPISTPAVLQPVGERPVAPTRRISQRRFGVLEARGPPSD